MAFSRVNRNPSDPACILSKFWSNSCARGFDGSRPRSKRTSYIESVDAQTLSVVSGFGCVVRESHAACGTWRGTQHLPAHDGSRQTAVLAIGSEYARHAALVSHAGQIIGRLRAGAHARRTTEAARRADRERAPRAPLLPLRLLSRQLRHARS